MKRHSLVICAVLVLCGFSIGCQSLQRESQRSLPASLTDAKICDIRKAPEKYIGKVVEFLAVYKSDHLYYSYLIDESCDSEKTINVVHPIRTSGDESVAKFFMDEDRRCRGSTVCPVRVEIDVEVGISRQPDGSLMAEFKKVRSYDFL